MREARHAEEALALSDPSPVGSDPGAHGVQIDRGGLLRLPAPCRYLGRPDQGLPQHLLEGTSL